MPVEYAYILLAVTALIAAVLYLRVRRRRGKKKSAPPVRPAAPANQTAGVAATWAPPAIQNRSQSPIAPTVVVPPSPSWDRGEAGPAAKPATAGEWGGVPAAAAPAAPASAPAPT